MLILFNVSDLLGRGGTGNRRREKRGGGGRIQGQIFRGMSALIWARRTLEMEFAVLGKGIICFFPFRGE